MKYWMIFISNKFKRVPIPFVEKKREFNTFFYKKSSRPTEDNIIAKAEELGIKKEGFSIHAVSNVGANYRNFDDPEIIVVDES